MTGPAPAAAVPGPLAARVAAVIKGQSYRYAGEGQLQEGIAGALDAAGIAHQREVRLSGADRIDFLVDAGLGIEVKIAGQSAAAARQLGRYAQSGQVTELMLVTTRARHRDLPRVIGGKPVHVVLLSGITS